MKLFAQPHQPSPTVEGWGEIKKIMLLVFPLLAFHTNFTTSDLKSKFVCHPNCNLNRTTSATVSNQDLKT